MHGMVPGIVPITRVCHGATAARPRSSRLRGQVEVVIAHARVDLVIVDSVFIIVYSLVWISRWGVVLAIVTVIVCITPVIGSSMSPASGNSAHPPIHQHYNGSRYDAFFAHAIASGLIVSDPFYFLTGQDTLPRAGYRVHIQHIHMTIILIILL